MRCSITNNRNIVVMLTLVIRRSAAFPYSTGKLLFRERCFPSCRSTTMMMSTKNLISVDESLSVYGNSNDQGGQTVFIDGSWHLNKERNGREEYENGPRVAGARYFDIDDVASKGSSLNPKGLPHMMPPPKLFAAAMDALDISITDDIVLYGTEGCMPLARSWYTFKSQGHPSVKMMQGSLKEWEERGGETETGKKIVMSADDLDLSKETRYKASAALNIANMDDVLKVVTGQDTDSIIIDARGAARFKAEAPEPREGLRGGHMPDAFNVPFVDLLDSEDQSKYKPANELRAVFEKEGIDIETEKRIICSCGSGVTACVIAAALEECGRNPADTFIYDGSWIEWGADPDTPVVS